MTELPVEMGYVHLLDEDEKCARIAKKFNSKISGFRIALGDLTIQS